MDFLAVPLTQGQIRLERSSRGHLPYFTGRTLSPQQAGMEWEALRDTQHLPLAQERSWISLEGGALCEALAICCSKPCLLLLHKEQGKTSLQRLQQVS